MNRFVNVFKWIMLVSGLLTSTMFLGLVAPEASLTSNFGQTLEGPVADIIVRNWSALIGLVGLMLIYGAFAEPVRRFALVIAGTSKALFILLVLTTDPRFLSFGAGTAVIADSIMIVLYAVYLIATVRTRGALKPAVTPMG